MLRVIPNWILHWDYEDNSFLDLIVSADTLYEAIQVGLKIMHGIKQIKSFNCYKQEL